MYKEIILKVLDKAFQYGVPLVKSAIENNEKEVITIEDIDNLEIDDDPTNWFNNND